MLDARGMRGIAWPERVGAGLAESWRRWGSRAVYGLLLLAGAFYVAQLFFIAFSRVGYAFDLEWMEGGTLEHVARVRDGKALYVAPSLQFTPFVYAPLYYWVCAPLTALFGLSLPVLRCVSIASTLGLLYVLYRLVRDATGDRVAGSLAVGTFAAMYAVGGAWLDLARVDSLYLFLLLLGVWLLLSERDILAALCFVAAVLTKQTALGTVAALCIARACTATGRARVLCGACVALALGLTVLALDLSTQGWFRYYVFTLPRSHPFDPAFVLGYWRDDLFRNVPFAIALALYQLTTPAPWRQLLTRWAAALGLVGTGYASRMHRGGWDNVLLPGLLFLAWMAGEAVARARASDTQARVFVPALLALQLGFLWYSPTPQIPTSADTRAGRALVARLAAVEGPILVPHHPHLARLAGKETGAHDMALHDVLLGPAKNATKLRVDVRKELLDQRFQAVVVDVDWWKDEMRRYKRVKPVPVPGGTALWTRTGWRIRPATFFTPAPPSARPPTAGAK